MRALLAILLAGCSTQSYARFTGKVEPPLATAAELQVFQGSDIPEGYKIIGVVTASCETYNGASGLFAAQCTDETMLAEARKKAAEVGGAALIEPRCSDQLMMREIQRVDGGGAKQNRRVRLQCQVSVGRPLNGQKPPRVEPAPSALAGDRVHISDADVTFRGEPEAGSPLHEARPVEDVGEIDSAPASYPHLGRVVAECLQSCSSSTARRGLKHAAAKLGAIAIADSSCEPIGDRWRCQATAIGDAIKDDIMDAGARADAADGS